MVTLCEKWVPLNFFCWFWKIFQCEWQKNPLKTIFKMIFYMFLDFNKLYHHQIIIIIVDKIFMSCGKF